jgi:hypothetical protein
MSAVASLTTALTVSDEDGLRQDAGGRRDATANNLPPGTWAGVAQRGRRLIDLAAPGSAQDPATLGAGRTVQVGEARAQATLSVPRRSRSEAPALLRTPPAQRDSFTALQQWEGTVLERRGKTILVRLADKTTHREEEAELFYNEVSPSDRDLIKPGAVFYWSIGYLDSVAGQRTRQSAIVFRRLPMWTASELTHIEDVARRRKALYGWP